MGGRLQMELRRKSNPVFESHRTATFVYKVKDVSFLNKNTALLRSIAGMIPPYQSNYALIFGKFGFPELGVQGAAISSVVSLWMRISPV